MRYLTVKTILKGAAYRLGCVWKGSVKGDLDGAKMSA
jgi:hypothetical protein